MGNAAHILKKWEKHNPEKVITDIALICYRINAMFTYHNNKTFFKDGRLKSVSFNIADDKTVIGIGNDRQFELTIQGVNLDDIAVGLDNDMDYLVPDGKLCSLIYIEDVSEENSLLLFQFVYEYLKLNPEEYLWFEWDYAFSLEDMKKIKNVSFEADWCFKKPK